jgi:hypothetical protein
MIMKLVLPVLFCFILVTAVCAENASLLPDMSKTCSLDIKDASLTSALNQLLKQANIDTYILTNDEIDITSQHRGKLDQIKVTLKIQNVSVAQALNALLEPQKLTFRQVNIVKLINGPAGDLREELKPVLMIDVTDRSRSISQQDLVSLELKQTPIRTALDNFLKGRGVNYVIDQSIDPKATISLMKLENVPFEHALKVMLKSVDPPLIYRKEGDTYHISAPHNTSPEESTPSNISEALDQITMRIPAMSVKEAVEKTEPGWTFKDKLGDVQMPGASFYQFPKDAAVSMLLISAGLVPPTNGSKLVTTKGKADLSSYIQWNPQKTAVVVHSILSSGPISSSINAIVAIGAYRTNDKKGEWLYTILASRASQTDLLDPLFSITGRSYLRAESGSGYGGYGGIGSAVSAQLYNLTLDNALDTLLPTMGLYCVKEGTETNPTYVVSGDLKQLNMTDLHPEKKRLQRTKNQPEQQ